MGNGHDVQLHVIGAGGRALVPECDGLGQRVAGHDALKIAEQVGAGVIAGLGADDQPVLALVNDVRGGLSALGEGGHT